MDAFIAGPALWSAFIIFFGGLIVRIVRLYRLSREKDQVIYNHARFIWGLKSILHWLLPWGSAAMRRQPVFTLIVFAFHITLFVVPLFLDAHIMLIEETWGISLWSLPDGLSDLMTVILLVSVLFLAGRRFVRREVRILTGTWDYVLIALTALPFLTGFLAFHEFGPYDFLMTLHLLTAEVLLILIPFTKLAHMVLFFLTRAFIGFEMGARRGARSW